MIDRELLQQRMKRLGLTPLSPEKEAWFIANFPTMQTKDMEEMMGYNHNTIKHYATAYSLHKTKEHLSSTCRKIAYRRIHMAKLKGTYKVAGTKFVNGFSLKDTVSEEHWAEIVKSRKEGRAKLVADEKRRVMFGLPQKSNLKIYGKGKQKTDYECRMRKKGYKLVSNYTFERPMQYTIPAYYIKRSENFGISLGYKFIDYGSAH